MVRNKEGFPGKSRLTGPSDFSGAFKSKNRSIDPLFLVLAVSNKLEYARLGLAISKKNVRTAVKRNRVKRIVRESFRQNQAKLSGLDVVVVSQKKVSLSNNCKLFNSLEEHWKQLIK